MEAKFYIYPLTGSQRAMIYRALSVYGSSLDFDSPFDVIKIKECFTLKEMFGSGSDSYLHDLVLENNGNSKANR